MTSSLKNLQSCDPRLKQPITAHRREKWGRGFLQRSAIKQTASCDHVIVVNDNESSCFIFLQEKVQLPVLELSAGSEPLSWR
ncbi:Hypothetical predicted protein [Scomber scombrus]|uniref:Uncharacterized protein n=1 Tax=Scomber scombrus TaxID=13677 RepID=A0AAV1QHK0_SCOSC